MDDESGTGQSQDDTNMRLYYMLHPSVDVDASSSLP